MNFLCTVFLLWLWSKFFSSFVLSQISLLWFSFIRFDFISLLGWWNCEIVNELPSSEACFAFLFHTSVLVQLSVVFVNFVGIVSWSLFVFLEMPYPLYLRSNNGKCFVCLIAFFLFLISLYFFLWGKYFPPAIVLRFYCSLLKPPFLQDVFLGHKFVQLQKILEVLVLFLYYKFTPQEYCLHNHGFEMEYLDDQ